MIRTRFKQGKCFVRLAQVPVRTSAIPWLLISSEWFMETECVSVTQWDSVSCHILGSSFLDLDRSYACFCWLVLCWILWRCPVQTAPWSFHIVWWSLSNTACIGLPRGHLWNLLSALWVSALPAASWGLLCFLVIPEASVLVLMSHVLESIIIS